MMTATNSRAATIVLQLLDVGYILLGGPNRARLVARPRYLPNAVAIDIDSETFKECLSYCAAPPFRHFHSGAFLGEIPEHTINHKLGWREMKLPQPPEGEKYYFFVQ